MEPTPEVLKAFNYVKSFFPEVSMVVFSTDNRWCYMDADFNAPLFPLNTDTSVLDEALDSVDKLPYIYQP